MPLRELARAYRCRATQRGLQRHRSCHAIAVKLQRFGYSLEPQVDGLSAGQVAGALGIDRKTVGNWIRAGKLRPKELCRFACAHRDALLQLDLDDEAWCWLLSLFDEFV